MTIDFNKLDYKLDYFSDLCVGSGMTYDLNRNFLQSEFSCVIRIAWTDLFLLPASRMFGSTINMSSKVKLSNDFKLSDLQQLSRIYANEYNNVEIHDRVLVFDIVQDERDQRSITSNCAESSDIYSNISGEQKDDNSFQIISKQDEGSSVTFTELTNPFDRKRAASEEDNLSTNHKKLRGLPGIESGKADLLEIEIPAGKENEINVECTSFDYDLDGHPIGKSQKPEPLTQTSNTNPQFLRQHKIFVHATWLAVHSSYFRSLFYSGMKESKTTEVHLKIPEFEEKGHLHLLEAIYRPDILNKGSVDELLVVLELADKYDVKFVFRKCKYVLQAMDLSLDICEKIMHDIEVKHNMTNVWDLASTVQSFLAKEFSPLDKTWQTESFKNLSEALLKSLLSSDKVATLSENTVFHALMYWIECNNFDTSNNEPHHQSSSLLSLVRFELLTVDYLYNVVQHHSIATKMAHFRDLYLKGISYHALTKGIKDRMISEIPQERDKVEGDIVQFTWIIEKDKLETLDAGAKINSEVFWWCGYEMQMFLEKSSSSASYRYYANVILEILGLTSKSNVEVSWKCKISSNGSCFPRHTFTDDKPESTTQVDLNFRSNGFGKQFTFPESMSIEISIMP